MRVKHFVVIDNSESDLALAKLKLDNHEFSRAVKFDYVSDAIELFAVLSVCRIDFVILDVCMRPMGVELGVTIRKKYPNIRIGYLTGLAGGADYKDATENGEFVCSKNDYDSIILEIERQLTRSEAPYVVTN